MQRKISKYIEISKTNTIRNILNDILIDKYAKKKIKYMLIKECKITAAVSCNIYKY